MVALVTLMWAAVVQADNNESSIIALSESGSSAAPVTCGAAGTVNPVVVAAKSSPCPGAVYCEHPSCGRAFCCPWGYFYSNGCTCRCFRSSYDAGAKCNSYFRCN